jgi:hypothetical protein
MCEPNTSIDTLELDLSSLCLLENEHILETPPSPAHTGVPVGDVRTPRFKMVCGGCNRVFHVETNFDQHFFCPWRGSRRSRKKLRKALGIPPIYHEKFHTIFDPEGFVNEFERLWHLRSDRYSQKEFRKYIRIFHGLSAVIQMNILYYTPDILKEFLFC